jgi:hypothetical protein
MSRTGVLALLVVPILLLTLYVPGDRVSSAAAGEACIACHKQVTPGVVADWQLSRHSAVGVDCATCHGDQHQAAADSAKAAIPTPETCGPCHKARLDQFKAGKHAKAWAAMNAMPTIHWQPMALTEGMRGCGGCHKIGLKSEAEIAALRKGGQQFGIASCDACHTRHVFSAVEASQPQACETCHQGFDHPQWEMYSSAKHGVRYLLRQVKLLPETAAAPTCQTCHMPGGTHGVRTAWGFLAVRLPMPENRQWAADRATILQALGVLDPAGKPTGRLEVVKAADVARLTQEDWQKERDAMIQACTQCHSATYAKGELAKGDSMIKDADHLLTFSDAPTVIEQKLFVMFLEHRMRTFQGAFHANPDYTFWYGWSEMQRDLTEIKSLADEMRARAAKAQG